MAGITLSQLNSVSVLDDTDWIPLARAGSGNGTTYRIYGSVFVKSSDITSLSSQIVTLTTEYNNLSSSKVSKSGDTMSGKLFLSVEPNLNPKGAVTKKYVDDAMRANKTWSSRTC